MKIPLNWLKEYIDITESPIEIAKLLTMAGLEVDAIETKEAEFSGVVVCTVLEASKHPNADKLCLAKVSDGTETYDLVCGAPNCRPGIKTALAKIGATLPDEEDKVFKVKKSKIRGVESSGMLCSYKELKISDEAEGIIEFDPSLPDVTDVAELFKDSVFEISLTPNLGHCANVVGVARELHASTGHALHLPKFSIVEEGQEEIKSCIKVEVKDPKRCLRYACRMVKGITLGPSPVWMQNRLVASGMRPVNNIVDITNYVLLELGQPLHAFDYDLLEEKTIVIRNPVSGETFVSLDDKERVLHGEDLLICDGKKPVALAGIIGGKNSEVNEGTKNVLLEAAYFCPSSIRKSSKRLGLITEASRRFERICDPNMVESALNRAAEYMRALAGGTVVKNILDIKEKTFEEKKIVCRVSRIHRLLGVHLGVGEVENIFTRLGFGCTRDNDDTFTVSVPTYRADVNVEVDLIEEVARLYGFDHLHKEISPFHNSSLPHSEVFLFERELRARMLAEGLQEFLTCDLIGPSLLEIVGESPVEDEFLIKVLNPTSVEQSCLRTSLLPGLLQVVKYNSDRQNQDISGFEIGKVHFKLPGNKYEEETVLGIILTGNAFPENWNETGREIDFYDLKGIAENMLTEFGISGFTFKNMHLPSFHPGRQASIYLGEREIGSIGEVHPGIIRRLGLTQKIYFGEFDHKDIVESRPEHVRMQAISKYPCSVRDWTITLKEEVPFSKIDSIVKSIDSQLLEEFQLRGLYRSEKLGKDQKNVTLRFVYRDNKKTISQEVVDEEHAKITDKIRSLIT